MSFICDHNTVWITNRHHFSATAIAPNFFPFSPVFFSVLRLYPRCCSPLLRARHLLPALQREQVVELAVLENLQNLPAHLGRGWRLPAIICDIYPLLVPMRWASQF